MIDIIFKTVNPSHLAKIKIMQNKNKLIFQFMFIFCASAAQENRFLKKRCLGKRLISLCQRMVIRTWGRVSSWEQGMSKNA